MSLPRDEGIGREWRNLYHIPYIVFTSWAEKHNWIYLKDGGGHIWLSPTGHKVTIDEVDGLVYDIKT